MAENNAQNQPGTHNSMERTLRIEGERSASMFGLAVRVAKIDQRLRELAVRQGASPRKAYRLASSSYEQAVGMFEDALSHIERDIEIMPRRASEGASKRDRQPKQVVKPQTKQSAAKPALSPISDNGQNLAPAESQPLQPELTKSQRKNRRKRVKKQQTAVSGTAQSKDQQQRKEQHQEPAPASESTPPTESQKATVAPVAGALPKAETPEAGKAEAEKPRAEMQKAEKPAAKPTEAAAPAAPAAPAEM